MLGGANIFLEKGGAILGQFPGGQFVGPTLTNADEHVSEILLDVPTVVDGRPGRLVNMGMETPNDLQLLGTGYLCPLIQLWMGYVITIFQGIGLGGVVKEHQVLNMFEQTVPMTQQKPAALLRIKSLTMVGDGPTLLRFKHDTTHFVGPSCNSM